MSTVVTVSGINYTIPAFGDAPSTGWGTSLSNFFIAVAAQIASTPALIQTSTVTTTPTAIVTGHTYLVNSTSISITMQLPTPVVNTWCIIKDSGFNCFTNNITIKRAATEKIDGVAVDFLLTNSGSSWMFISDGTDWFSVGCAYDSVFYDISDGNRYRILTNGSVISSQKL